MPVAASPPMGRVTAVTDPRTQQDSITVYNAVGQVVTTTDPLNLDTAQKKLQAR